MPGLKKIKIKWYKKLILYHVDIRTEEILLISLFDFKKLYGKDELLS